MQLSLSVEADVNAGATPKFYTSFFVRLGRHMYLKFLSRPCYVSPSQNFNFWFPISSVFRGTWVFEFWFIFLEFEVFFTLRFLVNAEKNPDSDIERRQAFIKSARTRLEGCDGTDVMGPTWWGRRDETDVMWPTWWDRPAPPRWCRRGTT